MNSLPSSLKQIALFLERLPGIGEKTANRLAFFFLRLPDADLQTFARHITELKAKTKRCSICLNLTEDEICSICQDSKRETTVITVVEDALDLLSFETGSIYHGVYHVLHGRIDPLNHVGPEDIFINQLLERVQKSKKEIKEIILATNPDMEGEATAMFLRNQLSALRDQHQYTYKVTRLGYGMPIGGNLEYADYMTLRKAIENRNAY